MLLWIFRTLASLLFSFLIFAALILWLVFSAVSADQEAGNRSQLNALAEKIEEAGNTRQPELGRNIGHYRPGQHHDLDWAQTLLPAVATAGVILMGLLHLPNLVSSLRWPGYALLVTGGAILLMGWLAQAVVPDLVGQRVDEETSGAITSALTGLLQGSGLPGLGLALAGALLIVGSHVLKRWQVGRKEPGAPENEPGKGVG